MSARVASLLVTWTAPNAYPGITGYTVRYRESGSSDPWTESDVSGNTLQHTIADLTVGTEYEVEVSAENDEGSSGRSQPATGIPIAGGGGGGGGNPSPVVPGDQCTDDIGALSGTANRSGTWADDCESSVSGRGYARYCTFTLSESTQTTIDLSSSVDTNLYVRSGSATPGATLHSNGDIESGNTDSQIAATLPPETYTIEATTYNEDTTGSFTLSVST